MQAKNFDKNISLCPLPLNTNLNYVNASDKKTAKQCLQSDQKEARIEGLKPLYVGGFWFGNLGDARIFATRHISLSKPI